MRMNIAYTGRKPRDVPYRFVGDLRALAADVDFLVIACPGGPATRHIVEEIAALIPDSEKAVLNEVVSA